MKRALGLVIFLLLACTFLFPPHPVSLLNGQPNEAMAIKELWHDRSLPLRKLKAYPTVKGLEPADEEDLVTQTASTSQPVVATTSNASASTLASAVTPLIATTPELNFAGVNSGSGWAQSDSNGAVGASQYVQWVNTKFAVFNKATGALVYGPVNGNTLWSGFGGACQTDNDGDGIAQYDKAAGQWVITTRATPSGGSYYQCFAISTTSDATGSYYRYVFQWPAYYPDYPKVGIWPDAYYMSANGLNTASNYAFTESLLCAFNRSAMLTGATASSQCFEVGSGNNMMLPADLDGSTAPPAGSPEYFLRLSSPNSLEMWQFHVDWTTPSNSTLTGPTTISVPSFSTTSTTPTVPQGGTTQLLNPLGSRLMYRLAYRNFGSYESLVAASTILLSSAQTAIRWYEVRNPEGNPPTVYQEGTFAPDSNSRWNGSIAMDHLGDIALGYSVSGPSMYPGISYTGRLATDALGTMETETSLIAGSASQQSIPNWGDYSSMSIDSSDDCTFWYTNQYLQTSGNRNWSTQIASFRFSACQSSAVTVSPASLTFGGQNVGTTSAAQTVTLYNTSGSTVSISSIAITGTNSGDFAQTNTCGSSVTSGGQCTISVSFTPTAQGARTATVTITDSANGSPQTVSLSGTGTISSSIGLSATSLSFGSENVSSTSTAENVTLTNNGASTLTINNMSITGTNSGDFAETNNCGSYVLSGNQCTIIVTFTPSAVGSRTASVTITDTGSGSPQTVNLNGTGTTAGTPAVSFSPSSLSLGSENVGVTSGAQTVTLKNTGSGTLSIGNPTGAVPTGIRITGANNYDFAQTNNCGISVAAGASCTITVTFTPSGVNGRFGNISVWDTAAGSPQTVSLFGSGTGTTAESFTPTSLTFANQNVYTTSTAQTLNLKNGGNSTLNIISINASGDFAQTNNCGTSLSQGASCNIQVTFTPSAAGTRAGYITVNDTDAIPLQTVNLSGTGQVPTSVVTISPRQASLTFTQQPIQFQASISGSPSSNVTWAVDGITGGNSTVGTISSSGLYTPPSTAGNHLVTATDNADQTETATAPVVITNYAGAFTYQNDNARDGLNSNETVLTTGNVNTAQFGKLFSYSVDGKIFAQPLYVPNILMPGEGVHNVVYVATENDSVYAFDADGNALTPIWQDSFINPSAGVTTLSTTDVNCGDISPQIGITGTPVIDTATNAIYVVVRTKEVSGSTTNYVQRLHALNLGTGQELPNSPVLIQATVAGSGTGSSNGQISFNPLIQNQRPGLLLLNHVIYIVWGSHCDQASFHGWMMGYNDSSLQQVAVYNTTVNGNSGGIWQGGGAPTADANGNIYVETANGKFDGSSPGGVDFGDSFLQLSTSSGLSVADYFTPSDQAYRNTVADVDLGSAGPMLLPDQSSSAPHLLVGSDKEGKIFLVNRDSMGGFNSSGDNIQQEIVGALEPLTRSLPAFWQNNVYYLSVADYLKDFRLYNSLLSTKPISQSPDIIYYPGSTPTISSNGSTNAIVWLIDNGNWYGSGGPAILYAYDAANISRRLYSSAQNASRDGAGNADKFTVPVVANGKVYVGTANQLDVYGLLP
jgi:hypothetical protein